MSSTDSKVNSSTSDILSSTSQSSIVAKHLTKIYPGNVIGLADLTVALPFGSVGLLGPNGSGKSTFIKLLLGLIRPTEGDAWVLGKNIRTDSMAIRYDVGYVPENDSLQENLNAVEVCKLFGIASGLSSSDAIQRAHEVLDYVGLDEARYRLVKTYSTGMKQRVKLAQALVHDPPLLLIDEPTNGLDPKGREDMIRLLVELREAGKSLVVSSHILPDIEEICEYVMILHNGRLVASNSLTDILNETSSRWIVNSSENRRFVKILEENGIPILHWSSEQILVDLEDWDPQKIIALAADHDIGLQRLVRPRKTLEQFFLAALNIEIGEVHE